MIPTISSSTFTHDHLLTDDMFVLLRRKLRGMKGVLTNVILYYGPVKLAFSSSSLWLKVQRAQTFTKRVSICLCVTPALKR